MRVNFCCCFYPTTVVCVDDDMHLLKWMGVLLEDRFQILSFYDPNDCVEFVKGREGLYNESNVKYLVNHLDEGSLNHYIHQLHERIYDAQRASEISILVVDYHMPGIDGLAFCKIFKNWPCKKIMLTGEADQSIAVGAFNEKIIDQFVMKGQAEVMEELETQVTKMQWQFFVEKKHFLAESLLQIYPQVFSYFADLECGDALASLLQEQAIKEMYLFNEEGDYLLINKNNQLFWLSIKNKTTIQALIAEAENEYLQEPSPEAEKIYATIKAGQKFPLSVLSKGILEISEWGPLMVKPRIIKTMQDEYQVLLAADIKLADLRYSDIQFV